MNVILIHKTYANCNVEKGIPLEQPTICAKFHRIFLFMLEDEIVKYI